MKQTELNLILEQHQLFLDGKGGICADLTHANLQGANLNCANLACANLTRADLTRANLRGANLANASLYGANLRGANLEYVKLSDAILPDISWIIPGCLVQVNRIKYRFYLAKEDKYENFVQDSFGFFIQNNPEEDTFDMLLGDRIIRSIPNWVKYSGMKQVATESVWLFAANNISFKHEIQKSIVWSC